MRAPQRTFSRITPRASSLIPHITSRVKHFQRSSAERRLTASKGGAASTREQIDAMLEERRKVISDSIRIVPGFPKEGILFQDITTLLLNPIAFQYSIEDFVEHFRDQQVEVIAGFEARGFIFGPPIALALHCPFVPLRKPGKLPGETVSAEYQLEYGTDKIEMSLGAVKKGQRVLLVDDLIATGGTLAAGVKLMKEVGGEVIGAACVIELPELKGRENLKGVPLYIQVEKEGV